MSDELKQIYAQEGKLHNFFEVAIPTDLFRGQKEGSTFPYMLPTLVGWMRPRPRHPDILLLDAHGGSPQYADDRGVDVLVTEDRETMPTTAAILESASRYTVKGCRALYPGKHRGVSTFDKVNPKLRSFQWIRLPTGTPIPPGLAVTRDFEGSRANASGTDPRHYTVAPKNDMPLALFLAHLRGLESTASQA